ncbi:Cysteine desulfurase [Chlamydiales bacterium SCGC AG-110-P3]|nr:Cysteine desulfurase [Chlamydiales bacterium SCGC AG-110-P3]
MTDRIYLDNNATTAVDPQVLQVLISVLSGDDGNPSSIHAYGQEATQRLSVARRTVARCLGVRPSEVVFTSGGTEALNLLIVGLVPPHADGHIITTEVEHSAVFQTINHLVTKGASFTHVPVGLSGAPSPDSVEAAIRPDTCLIAIMAVNNETGVMGDIDGIAAVAEKHGVALVVDGVALIGKAPFTIPSGVTGMAFSGHKFHAPKGIGCAYVKRGTCLAPAVFGGAQESGRRPGTENVAGICALAKALEVAYAQLPEATDSMAALRDRFEAFIITNCGNVEVNGTGPRICNTSNLVFHDVDGEALLMSLDLEGIAASHGSACASGALEPSRVLLAMGYDRSRASSSLRFSLARTTTQKEIDHAVSVITLVVERLRKLRNYSRESSASI